MKIMTAEAVRELLADTISQCAFHSDSAPDTADALLDALAARGLRIMPDLAKVAADGGYNYAAFHRRNGDHKGWSCNLHRGGIVYSDDTPFKSSPEEALAAALVDEGFDAAAYRAAKDAEVAA